MSALFTEKLFQESQELEKLWKDNPQLKKQKLIKEKKSKPEPIQPVTIHWSLPVFTFN
jgi:hypothetical protein